MARQRTTFGKIMREREKQQRAQAKQEKRAERAADDEGDGDVAVDDEPQHDESDVLASLAKLHEAFDNEQIDFDTFEERRAELMSRLKID